MRWLKRALVVLVVLGVLAFAGFYWYVSTYDAREPSRVAFAEHCASCHGPALEGTPEGPALMTGPLRHGDSVDALVSSIVDRHGRLVALPNAHAVQRGTFAFINLLGN